MPRKESTDAIIREGDINDLNAIMSILKSVGNRYKNPDRGFLVSDYTLDDEKYKKKYTHDLQYHKYNYVYEEKGKVIAFLLAFTKEEWLNEVPDWLNDIHWHPGFDKTLLKDFALINQTAMYPEFTGQGIGSLLYERLIKDLAADGLENIFAETIIAPVPNFASLYFRIKQQYELIGTRYEDIQGKIFTTLIYHKEIAR